MTSPLSGADATYLEALQRQFRNDPLSVDPGWRIVFEVLDDIEDSAGDNSSALPRRFRERGHLMARLDPWRTGVPRTTALQAPEMICTPAWPTEVLVCRSAQKAREPLCRPPDDRDFPYR